MRGRRTERSLGAVPAKAVLCGMGRRVALAVCACMHFAVQPALAERAFDFALIGDMPYTEGDIERFDRLILDVEAARPRVEWVVHVGDLRGGRVSPCSDAVFRDRFARMQRFARPFVFTPGDNDYLDCENVDPKERLAFLRRLFFPRPDRTTGGRSMRVESQSPLQSKSQSHSQSPSRDERFADFVENVLWTKGGVVFATLHTIGVDRPPDPEPELTAARNAAAVAWIETVFARARRERSRAVFLATQADPWIVSGSPRAIRKICRGAAGGESPCLVQRGGLAPIYAALEREAVAFGGPVLLATGDLHTFRIDKPLMQEATRGDADPRFVEQLTRVEAFGSPSIHWIRIRVDPADRDVFGFFPELIPENLLDERRTSAP